MSPVRTWLLRLCLLAVLVGAPFAISTFRLSLLTEILIFGLLAASLDLLVGYTGLPSLGHATYFGVGGYAAVLVAEHVTGNPLVALGVAVATATVVALGTGWLAVRTHGVYFLMLTLAFAQLLFSLAITWEPVTGGFNGLSMLPGELAGLELDELVLYFYVLVVVVLAYCALRLVTRAPFGRALVGIHQNEARMRSLGYSTFGYKLASFTVAGAFGGLAGALFVQFNRFISPTTVAFEISALVLIMVIMGGVGTLYGPVLGAALVLLLRDELSARFEHWELLLGLVFIVFVYALRGGLAELFGLVGRRLRSPADRVDGGLASEGRVAAPSGGAAADTSGPRTQGPPGAAEDSPLLELREVRKAYGSLVAVDAVSMTVATGERRALIGPNGAGKTTLFNLIGGGSRVTGGGIYLRGNDITRTPENRRARLGVAKTFQHSNLFDGLSARENVATAVRHRRGIAHRPLRPAAGYHEVDERAMQLLTQMGLRDRYAALAGVLSHGERRQLEVAVALAIEPTLLLLDEPVAGMSGGEREDFVAMVAQLPQDLTIIVIEHDMDVVFALADRISVLDAGRVLAEGTPDEVSDDPLVQEAYLGAGQTEIFQVPG
ncbi:MAG: ABC transporter permease subunit [Nocardioidaceae bacterium]